MRRGSGGPNKDSSSTAGSPLWLDFSVAAPFPGADSIFSSLCGAISGFSGFPGDPARLAAARAALARRRGSRLSLAKEGQGAWAWELPTLKGSQGDASPRQSPALLTIL